MNKAKQLPAEDRALGPNAQKFAEHLEAGLELFGINFQDYAPRIGQHKAHGMSLVFNQIDAEIWEDYDFSVEFDDLIVSVDEEAVRYPAREDAAVLPLQSIAGLDGTDGNSPESAALIFLSAIVKKRPIPPMICESCKKKLEEENEQTDC